MKFPTVWALRALTFLLIVGSLAFIQAPDVAAVFRKYWTEAPRGPGDPPLNAVVCVYGRIVTDSSGGRSEPVFDSAVIAPRCAPPALGAIGYVRGVVADDSAAEAVFVPRLCAVLRAHPEFRVVGLIHGIDPAPPRRVLIWACWSPA